LGAEEEPVRDVFVVWASFLEWDGAACLRHPDGGRIDAFFHMLHARLLSLESAIVARVPQLDGMIQSFNAMVARGSLLGCAQRQALQVPQGEGGLATWK
jgi:hypothetical protein